MDKQSIKAWQRHERKKWPPHIKRFYKARKKTSPDTLEQLRQDIYLLFDYTTPMAEAANRQPMTDTDFKNDAKKYFQRARKLSFSSRPHRTNNPRQDLENLLLELDRALAAPAVAVKAAPVAKAKTRHRTKLDWEEINKNATAILRRAKRNKEPLSVRAVVNKLGLSSTSQLENITEWPSYLAWKVETFPRKIRLSRETKIMALMSQKDDQP